MLAVLALAGALGPRILWLAAIPIALLMLVGIRGLFRRPFVRIDEHTLTVRQLMGRTTTYDVRRIELVGLWVNDGKIRGVALDYDDPSSSSRIPRLNRQLIGMSHVITDVYEATPAEIEGLISQVAHHLAEPASDPDDISADRQQPRD